MNPIYLHLGCGTKKFPGFVNIDLDTPGADMHLDLTKPLPWEQGSVKGIYSEHFIEHITQAQGIRLLMECRRVLQPGGVVRIATPDLTEIVDHYKDDYVHPDWINFDMDWTANRCERMNIALRWWGHQWVYDEEELMRIGKLVGLNVKGRYKFGESSDPMLSNREYRASSTLIVEFEKPQRQVGVDENPLVSIVIPAYKPRFFRAALESAVNQTYRNLDILICDDSEAGHIEDIAQEFVGKDGRVRYMRNPLRGLETGRENHRLCVREAKGDFVKFLNDDDLLAPHCVERLLNCFIQNPDITLATSKRQRIDANGAYLPDIAATQAPVAQDCIIDGLSLGAGLISTRLNFVGEPSTTMFRKSELADIFPDFGSIDRRKIDGIFDVSIWLNLLTRGNAVYLVEPLSFFRIHGEQAQIVYADICNAGSEKGWATISYAWRRLGFLQ
jgi:predicted SAM-dependent methyltransferase/glycosyltransferase involved in cell wall biosynthesis